LIYCPEEQPRLDRDISLERLVFEVAGSAIVEDLEWLCTMAGVPPRSQAWLPS
jgi:hypothetical protein